MGKNNDNYFKLHSFMNEQLAIIDLMDYLENEEGIYDQWLADYIGWSNEDW